MIKPHKSDNKQPEIPSLCQVLFWVAKPIINYE